MSRNRQYYEYWQEFAKKFVAGEIKFNLSHLLAIAQNLDFDHIKPEFLPNEDLGQKSLKKRRASVNKLSKSLYGKTPSDWLELEKEMLQKVREEKGSTLDDGKDDEEDLVTSQILIRIYATAYFVHKEQDAILRDFALRSLNAFLETAILKGLTRVVPVAVDNSEETKSSYSVLLDAGLPVAGTGKYLPDPVENFWRLIALLHKDSILPEVYQD